MSNQKSSFHKFFQSFLEEQEQYLHDLISATTSNQTQNLQPIITRVVEHYRHYYEFKSKCAKQNILAMFSPSWTSSFEDAFLWIGGWRPSMAFHLLYSKSGLQFETQLAELIRGISSGDLGDLSPSQLIRIDELQRRIIREEKDVTEKMAKHQETVADPSMVELSHLVGEIMKDEGSSSSSSRNGREEIEKRIDSSMASKEEGLEDILQMADELRLKTLEEVVKILSPLQAVHFLIAAAQLHLRIHEWGKQRDSHSLC